MDFYMYVIGDFNARLHQRFPEEEHIMGLHVFGFPSAQYSLASNRSLLAEICMRHKLVIANTLFDLPADNQITCYNVGKKAMNDPSTEHFGQIDFLLAPQSWLHQIHFVSSDRQCALASHNFLVIADLDVNVPREIRKQAPSRIYLRPLRLPGASCEFVVVFSQAMGDSEPIEHTVYDFGQHDGGLLPQSFHHMALLPHSCP